MNVHFSYKSSRSPEIEQEIKHQIEKLGKRLQTFHPELVHLHGGFEKGNERNNAIVSLNLRLPSGQITAQEKGTSGVAALKAAFHELTTQLNAHKDLLRNRYKWRRNTKERRSVPFEETMAAVHPPAVSDGEIHSFINANLPKLALFVERELQYREVNGLLAPDTVTREEVLGEAVAMALEDGEGRPQALGLEAWLHVLARRAILRTADGNRNDANMIHLEQPMGKQNVSGSDEEYLQFHQPDDYNDAEQSIADPTAGTPEQIMASDEFVRQIEAALSTAAPLERETFILSAIEGFSVEEMVLMSGRSEEEIRTLLENARVIVSNKLSAEKLKQKSLHGKQA